MEQGLRFPPGWGQEWFSSHVFVPADGLRFWLYLGLAALAYGLLIVGLTKLASPGRRRLIVVLTFIAGTFYVLSFFLPPGSEVDGALTVDGRTFEVEATRNWVHARRALTADEIEALGPTAPPEAGDAVAAQQVIAGQVLLTDLDELPEGVEPVVGEDILPFEAASPEGVSELSGVPWTLTVTTEVTDTGPVEVVATGQGARSFRFDLFGAPATLTMNVQPSWNGVKAYEAPLGDFLMLAGAFAIGLGVLNLTSVHGKRLVQSRPGWINSLAFFLGFFAMTVFGVWNTEIEKAEELAAAEEQALAAATGDDAVAETPEEAAEGAPDEPVRWPVALFNLTWRGLLIPLESTTFALLGFFIVAAAYRAFRIQSVEAGLLTGVAFLVMMGGVPLGQAVTAGIPPDSAWSWLRLEILTNWILSQPNSAAFRGIIFGAEVGGFALGMRVWLSLERGAYFGREY